MTSTTITAEGATSSHGSVVRYVRPSATIRPSELCGGCVPRPRKLSVDSVSTAHDIARVVCTRIGAETFGSTWRPTSRNGPYPRTRPALTYSALRTVSVGPRAVRMKIGR